MEIPYIAVGRPPLVDIGTGTVQDRTETPRDYHALFAAEVPFIPSLRAADFAGGTAGGRPDRIEQIVRRQVRFVSDLANAHELTPGAVAFDLRFVALPSPRWTGRSTIRILFFGKISHPDQHEAKKLGIRLWRKFASHFPLEDPFDYPLQPLAQDAFERWQVPIRIAGLRRESLMEVRKYEDRDPILGGDSITGYYPHPFVPALDFSAMGRFLETFSRQQQPCVASICLRPTRLLPVEHQTLDQLLETYATQMQRDHDKQSWLARQRERRLKAMQRAFDPLLDQRDHLFLIKVQVIGASHPPDEVVEALGAEFVRNVPDEPRRWARQVPATDHELRIALRNFHWLEHDSWGDDSRDQRLRRLRQLAAANEAVGAFRLPIPPQSGFLPGLSVRDEPFVLPGVSIDASPVTGVRLSNDSRPANEATETSVALGEIIHRGQPSGVKYTISLDELNRHALIAGVTGSGKTNTCLHLLSDLWGRSRIPFLVLYPIDKPDYRQLLADQRVASDLLIFTVGDENTAPFRFNPFAVPDGILLRTHLSRLLRCFTAAFVLWDPLPAVYRGALRRVYEAEGWDLVAGIGGGRGAGRTPTLSKFYDAIVACARELTVGYGKEASGNIRQGSEIRIRDLFENLGHVLDVEGTAPFGDLLRRPTVMELGRLGSSEDTALVMGFLLTLVSEEVQSRSRQAEAHGQLHLTLVEEAHRLMAGGHSAGEHAADPRAKGSEDFANLLAEVRGYGEGILIAEQIPSVLVRGAIGNTQLKIMHHLEDDVSFNLFCTILSLDERQREYARTLKTGDVLVRGPNGKPVHIRVENYGDEIRRQVARPADKRHPPTDTSDQGVGRFMRGRFALLERPLTRGSSAKHDIKDEHHLHDVLCWTNPKQCRAYQSALLVSEPSLAEDFRHIIAMIRNNALKDGWHTIQAVCLRRMSECGTDDAELTAYCYLYRMAQIKVTGTDLRVGEKHPFINLTLQNWSAAGRAGLDGRI